MQSTRIDDQMNYQVLDAMAEQAVAEINHDIEHYITTTQAVRELPETNHFVNSLGEAASADVAGRLAAPLCSRIANTAGIGVGVLVGSLTPPPFELGGALVGGVAGRSVTKVGCHLVAQALGRTAWKDRDNGEEKRQHAEQQLIAIFTMSRNRALTKLVKDQPAHIKAYLEGQFNHKIQRQDEVASLTVPYMAKINAILSDKHSLPTLSEHMVNENKAFLKSFQADDCVLDSLTHVKLNAILHEQKAYNNNLKKLDQNQDKEIALARLRGMEAGFNFVGELGVATNNKTMAAIGSLGAAGTSIAFNAAMITGSIPGVALSGWGLAVPYFGIAMAGLSIATTLFGRKKHKDNGEMQAMLALSRQLSQVSAAIQQRIIDLEGRMVELFVDFNNKISTHLSVLQIITNDGFAMAEYKLDHIQADLKRLTDIVKSGLAANYLQQFDSCMSAIEQYVQVKSDRHRELESQLITLTAWLTSPAYLKNSHDLAFPDLPASDLPNMSLFNKGVEMYVLGRMRLGSAAKVMDPEYHSINSIQAVADKGIGYLTNLLVQEKPALLALLAEYEATHVLLLQAIVNGARTRLLTGTVPTFEYQQHDPIAPHHTWPTLISGCAFQKVLNALNAAAGLTMPRLIQQALTMGIGTITAHYEGQAGLASGASDDSFGDWRGTHWINSRSGTYHIKVCYELNDNRHTLYSLTGTIASQQLSHTGLLRFKGGGGHHRIGNEYNQVAAGMNAVPADKFLKDNWGVAQLSSPVINKVDMVDALKSMIIDAIVAKTINADNNLFHAETVVIANEIANHPPLLNGLPQQLSECKKKMVRMQALTCAPYVSGHIVNLWGEAEVMHLLSQYKHVMPGLIQSLKVAIASIHDHSPREPNLLLMQLQYCRGLLEVVKQYESMSCLTAMTELSETLQVSEDIVFSADQIACEMSKDNELGSGGFGSVYRATDRLSGQALAVKMLFPGAKLLEAARGELQVIGRLQQDHEYSPYLVKMFGVTRLNERDCIVMEYIPNHTLDFHLYETENRLSVEQRTNIAKGIVHGLAYLHARHITHGDIKSANVLLTDQFTAKIADYGLAQVTVSTHATSTVMPSSQKQVGTLYYMPPEFFKVDSVGQPTTQSDIYALGVLLWQLLTNQKPFAEINGHYAMIMMYWGSVLNNLPAKDHFAVPEPEALQPAVSAFFRLFKPIVTDCRMIDPAQRPTAAMLQSRLE